MAASTSERSRDLEVGSRRPAQNNDDNQLNEMTTDVVNYVTEYARENPGYAALWCLGVGFVLGWKLKPW